MTWTKHSYEFIVQETHLDGFGHMNNAVYLEIFENARWDFITPRGFGYAKIQEIKMGPTILDIHLQFKRELKLRDKIRIETCTLSYEGKIGTLEQRMFNEAGDLCTVMTMKMGLFDMNARKLISPTPEWLRAVGLEN